MRLNLLSLLSASAIFLAVAVQESQAAIVITFSESGGDVTASIGGSIDLTGLHLSGNDINPTQDSHSCGSRTFVAGLAGQIYDSYSGGQVVETTLNSSADILNTTEVVGFNLGFAFVPGSVPQNGIYTPSAGQFVTWQNKTLAEIGLGSLGTTPVTVWNNPNASGTDGAFQFVGTVVPEPSALTLCSIAVLGGLIRRRQ